MQAIKYLISIFLFPAFLNPIFSQGSLLLEKSELDAREGYLSLSFSEPLNPNYLSTTASLVFYPSLGSSADKIYFSAPLNTVPGSDNNTVLIYLNTTQLIELERFSQIGGEPLLDLAEGSFGSQTGNVNPAYVGYEISIKAEEIVQDSTRFNLHWANLNISRGILELHFNNPRDLNTGLNSGIRLFNNSRNMEISQNELQIDPYGGTNQLNIKFNGSQLESLRDLVTGGNELFLALDEAFATDIYGNSLTAESEYFVEYQSQIQTLDLYWVQINWEQNILELEFNNKVVSMNNIGKNPLKLETKKNSLEIINPEFIFNVAQEDFRAKIKIDALQLDSVQTWQNLENELIINIPQGFFEDEFGNLNSGLQFEVNRPKGDSTHFHLIWAAIDPMDGVLFLEYNNPIDLNSFSSSSVLSIYKNGTAIMDILNPQDRIEASTINRILRFKLETSELETLQSDSISFLEIGLISQMVKDIYGNFSPEEFRRPLQYNARNNSSNQAKAEYFPNSGKIIFEFPFSIDDSKTNFRGGISISSDNGGPLSLNIPIPWDDISAGHNDSRVEIVLEASARDQLNRILDPKYETLVRMDSGIFTSLETGESNKEITYTDFWHLFINAGDSSGHDAPEFVFEGLSENQIWYADSLYSFQIILEDTSSLNSDEEVGIDGNLLPDYIVLITRGRVGGKYILSFAASPKEIDAGITEIQFKLFGEKNTGIGEIPGNETLVLIKTINILKPVETPAFKLLTHTSGGSVKLGYSVISGSSNLKIQNVQFKLTKNGVEITSREKREAEPVYYPLGDGIYDVSCEIQDINGNNYTLNKSIEITGVSNRKIKAGNWEMVGILGKNVSTTGFGKTKTLAWWKDDAEESNLFSRYLLDTKIPFLERGKGYWVFSENDYALHTPDSNFLDSSISVRLAYGYLGWNQISNPFPYSIDVSSSGLIFYGWDAETADVINVNGILAPGEAYWVNVEKEQSLKLNPAPYFSNGSGPVAKTGHAVDLNSIQFSLSANGKTDNYNFLKVQTDESIAELNRSNLEAPKMGSHISLYFKNQSKNLKTEKYNNIHVAYDQNREIWQKFFIKSSDLSADVSSLSLEGIDEYIQNGYHAYILSEREVFPIVESGSVTLKISSKEKEYTLVVTKNANFKEDILSTEFSLSNYPNPVRTATSFAFSLPYFEPGSLNKLESEAGKIEVYNAYGKIVAAIDISAMGHGTHEIKWIPKDTNGKFLTSGSYYYQLKIGSIFKSRKMLIIPN